MNTKKRRTEKGHESVTPALRANPALLQFCWHLRVGLVKGIDCGKMKEYVDFFYATYLDPHLCAQEQLILAQPALQQAVVRKAMIFHRRLRRLFAATDHLTRVFSKIEDNLELYARFEQRELFAILLSESKRNGVDAENVGRRFYDSELAENLRNWPDKYWALS